MKMSETKSRKRVFKILKKTGQKAPKKTKTGKKGTKNIKKKVSNKVYFTYSKNDKKATVFFQARL